MKARSAAPAALALALLSPSLPPAAAAAATTAVPKTSTTTAHTAASPATTAATTTTTAAPPSSDHIPVVALAGPLPAAAALPARIADRLEASSRSSYLGSALSAKVVDYRSGRTLWSHRARTARMPASTQKVVTAYTVLRSVNPRSRIVTRAVRSDARPHNVYLRGAGDPTLSGARLADLARRTAAGLKASGTRSIALYVDTSAFPTPTNARGWRASYVPAGEVRPVRALSLRGHRGGNDAIAAGGAFRDALAANGIRVRTIRTGTAPAARTQLASTSSATYATIVQAMLRTSNNDYAEHLLRLAARSAGHHPTWANSLAHQRRVLASNKVPAKGFVNADGSGLSRANRMPVDTLVSVVRKLYANPADRRVVFAAGGMPRAGQTGTLAGRYGKAPQRCAAGRVLAKTGTLRDVVGLAGITRGVDGRTRVFAFLENGHTATTSVRNAVDAMAATTVGCRL